MGFRDERRRAALRSCDVAAVAGPGGSALDVPTYSKIEHGRVLPVPSGARAIAKRIGCRVGDLITPADVDSGLEVPQTPRKRRLSPDRGNVYKFTARLETGLANALNGAYRVMGYASLTDWLRDMARHTIDAAANAVVNTAAKEKADACADTQTTARDERQPGSGRSSINNPIVRG